MENVGPLIWPTLKYTPVVLFVLLFSVSSTFTAVVTKVWLRAGPLPFSVKMRMTTAPRAVSTLEVRVGSLVMPKVTLTRTYSVVVTEFHQLLEKMGGRLMQFKIIKLVYYVMGLITVKFIIL